MKMMSMKNCLVIAGSDLRDKFASTLAPEYSCRMYPNFGRLDLESMYEHFDFICLLVHITNSNFHWIRHVIERMQRIRSFPVIAIIQGLDLEIARLCGKIGIDQFIDRQQLITLKNAVSAIDNRSKVKVQLKDFAMEENDYPVLVNKSLKYIEENYISLAGVSEIARALGVCEGTLSRLFKKHVNMGPKRLLMQFKMFHAINLMKQGSLSLTRIATYSGFTCEKRLNECFNNHFKTSAKYYREHFLLKNKPAVSAFNF